MGLMGFYNVSKEKDIPIYLLHLLLIHLLIISTVVILDIPLDLIRNK